MQLFFMDEYHLFQKFPTETVFSPIMELFVPRFFFNVLSTHGLCRFHTYYLFIHVSYMASVGGSLFIASH